MDKFNLGDEIMKQEKLIKVGQEMYAVYGRSRKELSKVTVSKVGRKYFYIGENEAGGNEAYHLRMNNGYFYNTDDHVGYSSHLFFTKQEALFFQQGDSIKNRVSKVIDNFSYNEVMEFLNKYEEES